MYFAKTIGNDAVLTEKRQLLVSRNGDQKPNSNMDQTLRGGEFEMRLSRAARDGAADNPAA